MKAVEKCSHFVQILKFLIFSVFSITSANLRINASDARHIIKNENISRPTSPRRPSRKSHRSLPDILGDRYFIQKTLEI